MSPQSVLMITKQSCIRFYAARQKHKIKKKTMKQENATKN